MKPFFAIGLPHGAEWIWIALIVIVLFGAERLPKLAKGLGRSLGEFKKAKDEFDKEMHSAAQEPSAENPRPLDQPKTVATIPATAIKTESELSKKS